jgi:DNA-binding MarR family transcriptional regulator
VPDPDDLGPRLGGRLGYLLKHAYLGLIALHEEVLGPFGISDRELAILLLLDGREPESQQQAARRLGVDRTTMVGLVDGLEGKGLVVRRPDPADRRRNVVALTPTGRTLLDEATRASDEAEARLLAVLDPAERDDLREMLRRVTAARPS